MTSCFPCIGGSITDLSVADNCLFADGDGASLTQYANAGLVNIAHIGKLNEGARNHSNPHMKIYPLSPEPLIG